MNYIVVLFILLCVGSVIYVTAAIIKFTIKIYRGDHIHLFGSITL